MSDTELCTACADKYGDSEIYCNEQNGRKCYLIDQEDNMEATIRPEDIDNE